MYTECNKEDCTAKAIWTPKLIIPCQGLPLDLRTPFHLLYSLPLCPEHFNELNPQDFINDSVREIVAVQERLYNTARPVPMHPDFDRAQFAMVSLTSDEYRKILSNASAR